MPNLNRFLKKNIRLVRCESRIMEGTLGRVIHHVDSDTGVI